jgi:hypothetical protein
VQDIVCLEDTDEGQDKDEVVDDFDVAVAVKAKVAPLFKDEAEADVLTSTLLILAPDDAVEKVDETHTADRLLLQEGEGDLCKGEAQEDVEVAVEKGENDAELSGDEVTKVVIAAEVVVAAEDPKPTWSNSVDEEEDGTASGGGGTVPREVELRLLSLENTFLERCRICEN